MISKLKDTIAVMNHATKRAQQRFGLTLNNKALKELEKIAAQATILGYQTFVHKSKRSLRMVNLYYSDETRKLNPDIKEGDCLLAVCGSAIIQNGRHKFKIFTFLPETEVDGQVFRSTYNCENMRW